MTDKSDVSSESNSARGFLGWVEWAGNKLPDPAMLFVWALLITWLASALLAPVDFADDIDPRTKKPLEVKNQLTGEALTVFMTRMVETFVGFPPATWPRKRRTASTELASWWEPPKDSVRVRRNPRCHGRR